MEQIQMLAQLHQALKTLDNLDDKENNLKPVRSALMKAANYFNQTLSGRTIEHQAQGAFLLATGAVQASTPKRLHRID